MSKNLVENSCSNQKSWLFEKLLVNSLKIKSPKDSIDEMVKMSQGNQSVEESKADCSSAQILSGSSQKYLALLSQSLEEL